MLRTRVLRPRWLTSALILWAAVWLALPAPADGAPLPPSRGTAGEAALPATPELASLREALMSQGLSSGDADLVLSRLSPAERDELARRAAELGVGGDSGLLIFIIIIVVAILLYLPMAGRMQGWW